MAKIFPTAIRSITDDFAAHVRRGSGLPGIDFPCAIGTPAWATDNGVVTRANYMTTNGWNVRIRHDDGITEYQCHFSRLDVVLGQRVSQGQQIGLTGSSGKSTGGHDHLSYADQNGNLIDPLPLLTGGSPATSTTRRSIKLGSRGTDVVYLQQRLGIGADGIFGPLTRRAVIAFQKSRLLAADGIVGPRTWAALG